MQVSVAVVPALSFNESFRAVLIDGTMYYANVEERGLMFAYVNLDTLMDVVHGRKAECYSQCSGEPLHYIKRGGMEGEVYIGCQTFTKDALCAMYMTLTGKESV